MASFDRKERTNVSFPYQKNHVNDGEAFFAYCADADLDIAGPLTLSFTTPATTSVAVKDVKITAHINGLGTLEVLEGTTITADTGNNITPLNRSRDSAATSGVLNFAGTPVAGKMAEGATITDAGTTLFIIPIGIASQNNEYVLETDLILKSDTNYTIRLTAVADNSKGDIFAEYLEYVQH